MRKISLDEFQNNVDEIIFIAQQENIIVTINEKDALLLSKYVDNDWDTFFKKWESVLTSQIDDNDDPRIDHLLGK